MTETGLRDGPDRRRNSRWTRLLSCMATRATTYPSRGLYHPRPGKAGVKQYQVLVPRCLTNRG